MADVSAGDWLAAAGNIVGVAIAIWGALYVEHYRRRTRHRETMSVLKETLHDLDKVLKFVGDCCPSDWHPYRHRRTTILALREAEVTLAIALDTVVSVEPTDYRFLRIARILTAKVGQAQHIFRDHLVIIEDAAEPDEDIAYSSLYSMFDAAANIRETVLAALNYIDDPKNFQPQRRLRIFINDAN